MSFEQLQQAILDEAKKQIGEINNRYDKEMSAEEDRIKTKAKELEEQIISQAEKDGQMEAQRLHQSAQLEARAQVLSVKQAELDQVLLEAKKVVLGWDKEQTRRLNKSLFELVPEKSGKIVPGAEHEDVVTELARQKGFTVSKKKLAGEGGFVFKGTKTELNATVGYLLKQLFEQERTQVAKVLFD